MILKTAFQNTVNSLESDHPLCTTKWSLTGGGRLREVVAMKELTLFRKFSHRICSNFAIMEAIMAGTYSLKRFLQKTPGTEKHKDK